MNLILLDEKDRFGDNRARVTGRAFRHAQTVLQSQTGEKLRVGFVNGLMADATVTKIASDFIEIEFESWRQPPPPLPLHLFIALPRPKVLLRVLQTASTLGIKNIHLMNSSRVEKSFWHCDQLKIERTDLALRLGLEQARDTILPTLSYHRRLKPFVEDELPALIKGRTAFIAHPASTIACPSRCDAELALAVGPEGGFIPYEIDLFASAGFSPIHLGPRILKVETALTALVSRLCQIS